MPRAILFDIDGTLVDSVDLHARAWKEAFAHFNKILAYDEVRSQIGKGGDHLIPTFLAAEEQAQFGEKLERYRGEIYKSRYLAQARPFPHARDLVARVKAAGLLVGLASSCKQDELEHYLKLIDIEGLVDAATTADDAERSKPDPDIFRACTERLGVSPRDCIAVGDSPYDAIAAGRAGIETVGLLAGGFAQRTLEEAGCIALYTGVADLLARFDASPLAPREEAGLSA